MNLEEFVKRYKELLEKCGTDMEVSDEELIKMYLTHIVMRNWDVEEMEKFSKSASRQKKRLPNGIYESR